MNKKVFIIAIILIASLIIQCIIICDLLTKRNRLLNNKYQIITQPIPTDIDGTYSDVDTIRIKQQE